MIEQDTSAPHIGLNAQLLSLRQSYRSAGISGYIFNLLQHLASVDPGLCYTAFVSEAQFRPANGLRVQRSRWPAHNPAFRILWEQTALPLAVLKHKVDLLHALAFVAPVAAPCPFIITIYDVSFARFPEAFRPLNRLYLAALTRHSARRARAIITISESTRRDVVQMFGVAPQKVHTIYCGVGSGFEPLSAAQVNAFKVRRGLPDRFALQLGTIEPRKNVEGVVRAYAGWRAADKSAPPLFIAGGKGWYYRHIFQLVQTLGLEEQVIFPGYVPQEELPLWYNAADFFVYPSRFEGFGLPVLEAMACGTPVITSNVSSLPEVAGQAALTVNPADTAALGRAMRQVFCDPALKQAMVENGLRQAANFSWQKTAAQTTRVYRQLLSS